MNTEQVPKPSNVNADPVQPWGRLASDGTRAKETPPGFTGAWVRACSPEETCGNTGSPTPRKYRGFREDLTELGGMGVPCIKDRVAQMAAVVVLEPIFEADLPEEQYGYRRGRSAHDAIRTIHGLLNQGHREVVDCDPSGYFDSIPHHDLMKSVARRVSDGAMLALIKAWLQTPVEEDDQRGGKRRTTVAKDSGRGTPQGAPISPLLSNLYMRRFVLGWKQLGWEEKLPARVVVYADDFVILCRNKAEEARKQMQTIMSKLKLTVNEQKTRVCRVPEASFDFLGYTLGRCYSPKTGRSFIGTRPSRKRISAFCDKLSFDAAGLLLEARRNDSGRTQSDLARLGQLFLPWRGQPSVSGGG